jgi:SpoVK/Ycf46/Vps4 family AAA+-type ATPase
MAREIAVLSRAGYPLVYIVTHEEDRAVALVDAAARASRKRLLRWSLAAGFEGQAEARAPAAAIEAIEALTEPAFVLLLDFHRALDGDPSLVRRLREVLARAPGRRQSIVIVAPSLVLPDELAKETAILDLPLPSAEELAEVLTEVAASEKLSLDPEVADRAVRSALGLTAAQAGRAFRKVMVLRRGLGEDDLALIVEEKKSALARNDVLEFHDLAASLGDVGGLGELKRWLGARTSAFGDEARRFGLPPPKGLLLLGVQGCGKSLSAKAVAHLWKFPLLRLDVGALFGGTSAAPEGALRHAMKVSESLAPVVLWVDEIEKGFASSGESESTTRVFGSFITWLSEKQAQVFVVATANDVSGLPPELLRRGRFDEVFFVDLPNVHERLEILKIHVRRRGRDPEAFPILPAIAKAAEHFSGAELEQVVVSALYLAFSEQRELAAADLEHAVKHSVPLYRTYEERIKAVREWARSRARPATLDRSVLDMFGQ